MQAPLFADIILPLNVSQTYTYGIPPEFSGQVEPGMRVMVQFAARRYYSGVVYKLHNQPPAGFEVKPIAALIDAVPVLTSVALNFWTWLSAYYCCSLGEIMIAALPAALKLESESIVSVDPDYESVESLTNAETFLLQQIESKKRLKLIELFQQEKRSATLPVLRSLMEKGIVRIEEEVTESYRAKQQVFIRLRPELATDEVLNDVFDSLKRAAKQAELLTHYLRISGFAEGQPIKPILKKELLQIAECTPQVIKSLIDKQILEEFRQEVSRFAFIAETPSLPVLSEPQQKALKSIQASFVSQSVVLLHGVTSSGKTELYMHLIRQTLDEGKKALLLLPEIALTAQIINRMVRVFGDKVGVYHSKYSDAERAEVWNRVSKPGGFELIIGVRSAVFLPIDRLGLIIVDEEHDPSYKQYDPAPRYQARDAAIVLGHLHQGRVLLASATPSIESYYNAQTGKYALVRLTERFGEAILPQIQVVDIKKAEKKGQMKSMFSDVLLQQIQKTLDANQQVLLFRNRRGFSPFLQCGDCGHIPVCRYCDVSLTYHKNNNQLVCHYCGYTEKNSSTCSKCQSHAIRTVGFGTEKIEDELSLFFPTARIGRMDTDSTRSRKAYSRIISEFENHQTDILVGTQMITKGMDFERVRLVGILDADSLLNFPDFRAYERAFQLMSQVAGRAGRRETPGLVLIQTRTPEHPILRQVIEHNYEQLYTDQVAERSLFNYPPYYRLIQLKFKHRDRQVVTQAAAEMASMLRKNFEGKVYGPNDPAIERIQSLYLKSILFKMEREANLGNIKKYLMALIDHLRQIPVYKQVQVILDVDPY